MRGGRCRSLFSAAAFPGASPVPAIGSLISPGLTVPAPALRMRPVLQDLQPRPGSPLPRDGDASSFSGIRVKLGQSPRLSL